MEVGDKNTWFTECLRLYSLPQSYNQTSKCKRCISSNAYLGNNQCMTWRYRITVIERHTSSRLTNNFHSSRQTAERTYLPFVIINSCLIVHLFYILKNLSSFFELPLFYRLTYNFFLLDKKQKELSI